MVRTLVLGIGNELLSDEGAGVHAVRHFERGYSHLPNVTCLDGGTLSFTLAGPMSECENLIVFDAARLGTHPGSVRCLVGEPMDRFVRSGKLSVHEVGLADLLDISRLCGHLPERRALIGIEPACFEWGDTLSGPVADGIPEAIRLVLHLIESWTLQAAPVSIGLEYCYEQA